METLLSENIRYLIHMRQRMHGENRLGLCLGAGVSMDFGIPSWRELIKRIAEVPEINGRELLKASESLTAQSQFLYQRYLKSLPPRSSDGDDDVLRARRVNTGWLHVVQKCLYQHAKTSDADLKDHPYLWSLVPLMKKSAMTINYNFDDTVERTLYLHNKEDQAAVGGDDKGFEVVWQPSSQFRRDHGVIYHPNGFLPLQTIDGFSEQIVFMEQEFADQLVDVSAGHYLSLLNHLSKHTIVFIGVSLDDTNLKHLLRVSARHNPGNFHYHIHWCENTKPPPEEQEAIGKANFAIYNLVTLFLTTEEIRELSQVVVCEEEDFRAKCDAESEGARTEYRYYLTGIPGSGKTTTIEQIKSVATFDEWVDRRHELLGRSHYQLSATQRASVDAWINQQFRKKNRRVSHALEVIALVDRSPLDPLYFVKDKASESKRASELMHWMVPPEGGVTSIAPGHVIILQCDPRVLQVRLATRDKTYTQEELTPQAAAIEAIWKGLPATIVDTTNMSVSQVTSKVLEIILFEKYHQIDIHKLCTEKAEAHV